MRVNKTVGAFKKVLKNMSATREFPYNEHALFTATTIYYTSMYYI